MLCQNFRQKANKAIFTLRAGMDFFKQIHVECPWARSAQALQGDSRLGEVRGLSWVSHTSGPILKMPPTGIHSYTALAKFLKEIMDKAKQRPRSLLGIKKPKM